MPAFTKFADTSRIKNPARDAVLDSGTGGEQSKPTDKLTKYTGALMPVTGELIRAMNYVEDITATLRRISIYIPAMNTEERKRLAESLRATSGAINTAIADLEKVGP
ncbi:MAG TPA: hypothetical protein VK930_01195 [Verrucomicrobiae bacterium]|jgi:hypothetical protein|nr:hypothetical protein [Verrucomicrobiae bacterium]